MGKGKLAKTSYLATAEVNEVWASTKAYPSWWTDLEESKILRRRKSVDDPILERNICFVDTPGYGHGLSITEGIQNVISYIEQQLPRSFSTVAGNRSELVSMFSGNGGTQVDAVLYMIGKGTKCCHCAICLTLTFSCIRNQTSRPRLPSALITDHERCALIGSGRHFRLRRPGCVEAVIIRRAGRIGHPMLYVHYQRALKTSLRRLLDTLK